MHPLLPLCPRLAVRTLEYDKTKTDVGLLYSKHKILEIQDLFKLSVAK